MDDELEKDIDPVDEEEDSDDLDDISIPGKIPGKGKPKAKDDDLLSLDELGEEEEDALPEDRFDDVEPEDLW